MGALDNSPVKGVRSLDVFISETKNTCEMVERTRRRLGFEGVVTVDPICLAGGMALF